jgi:hypothetical protein
MLQSITQALALELILWKKVRNGNTICLSGIQKGHFSTELIT